MSARSLISSQRLVRALEWADRRLASPSDALVDEEERRRAKVLCRLANVLGIILTVAAGISLITTIAFPDPDVSLGYRGTATIAAAAVLFWLSLQLARRPRYQIGAWLMMATIDAFVIALALITPTISDALVLAMVVPVLLSTIVLPARGTVVVFLATIGLAVPWLVARADTVAKASYDGAMVGVVSGLTMLVSLMREQDLHSVRKLREMERADDERLRADLDLARRVQLAMQPDQLPQVFGLDTAAYSEPAYEASGDFYDMFQLDRGGSGHGRIGVVVCDVAGKGIASALVMSAARAALRAESVRHASPGAVLARVNQMLANSVPPGLFVTAFYGIFDPATARLRYASGGHPHPIRHSRRDLVTTELRSDGLPLGLVADAEYEDQTVVLDPGDLVVVYSDGLVEALDAERRMYGFDAAHQAIAASAGMGDADDAGAVGHLGRVVDDMRRFIGDERLHDDVTVVVLSVATPSPDGPVSGDGDG